jgi:E3 ubiquitin-protein ligase RNF14
VHDDTWHEGETCEEYDYKKSGRKESDESKQEVSVQAISQLKKKCPGTDGKCGWNIEKNSDYDHMTCMFPSSIAVLIRKRSTF